MSIQYRLRVILRVPRDFRRWKVQGLRSPHRHRIFRRARQPAPAAGSLCWWCRSFFLCAAESICACHRRQARLPWAGNPCDCKAFHARSYRRQHKRNIYALGIQGASPPDVSVWQRHELASVKAKWVSLAHYLCVLIKMNRTHFWQEVPYSLF